MSNSYQQGTWQVVLKVLAAHGQIIIILLPKIFRSEICFRKIVLDWIYGKVDL